MQVRGETRDAKIALCMIVAGTDDEAAHLSRCLKNVAPHVDGVFLNLNTKRGHKVATKLRKVAEAFTSDIITTEWHEDFAEARNANIAQVPPDYTHILWLDADDTLDHPERLRKVVEASKGVDVIFVDYLYDTDEEGNPLTVHMVGRIFRNNGSQVWKGRIHETLVDTRSSSRLGTKDLVVVHHADEGRKDKSLARNIELLKAQLDDEKNDPDPRTLYYLGCSYMDAGDLESACSLLETYLTMSGWDEERCAAHTKLGRIYLDEGNHLEAKKHFMQAIGEAPGNPEPRVEMGSLELEMKQLHKARKWLEDVLAMEKSVSTLERNPMSYTFRTYLLLADAYLQLGGSYLPKALEYAKKAQKYKKKDKRLREYVRVIEQVAEDKTLAEGILALARKLKKNHEEGKLKTLLESVPKQLDDNPLILRLRDDGPFTWPEKSVVIMCGDTPISEWGPWSLAEGIGGSEEAVIRLSKHLTDLGYKVVVYANPSARAGLYDGVMWRNFWEVNLDDHYDIFVAWRSPYLFDRKIDARKRYLWMHDVMPTAEFTPERIANFDKCILLSKYHRSLFPMIPDEKVLLSGNGIDPDEFEGYELSRVTEAERFVATSAAKKRGEDPRPHLLGAGHYEVARRRDPHKVFYGSSHVRGLRYLYEIWPDVRKAVPDATLDVYYGRQSYDAINAGNPERMQWMDDMMARAKELPGVTDHGKVGQDELIRHMFESGVWAYPTTFPEISCITAMKCQAAGAVPVVSNFAALQETVQFGEKLDLGAMEEKDLERYKERLIWWLQHPEDQERTRPDMQAWARTQSWRAVAEQWSEDFAA